MMKSTRPILAALVLAFVPLPGAMAQESMLKSNAPPPTESKPFEMTIRPRLAPSPVFRYRLMPMESERTPGDAAPIYLRIHGEFTDGMKLLNSVKSADWLRMSPELIPQAEGREFLATFQSRLKQIEYGSRRRTCDWNYTLAEERENSIEILLPDVQFLRHWGRIIAFKARLEVAENKPEEALKTLETGLAFSRHLAEGPFLINGLIAIATANSMLDQVEELIARTDAPNLYWALTALPRPLINLGKAMETEMKMIENILPELDGIDKPRSEAEWTSLLIRFHERLGGIWTKSGYIEPEVAKKNPFETDLGRFRARLLPQGKAYFEAKGRSTAGFTDDQVVMTFAAMLQAEIRDEWAKALYLPTPQASKVRVNLLKPFEGYKDGPLGLFLALAPAVEAGQDSTTRLDRKVAALRVIEAIRMQAAQDGGKLPASLDKVSIVPVPLDPATGLAFEYRLEGETATLTAPVFGGLRPNYRITLKK